MITGHGGRRAAQRAELLEAVRTEAYRQIAEGGLAAVSMSAIAHALGVSGAALYRYFASRDELVRVLLVESLRANADVVVASLTATDGGSPLVRLRHLLEALHEWAVAHPVQYAVVSGSVFGAARDAVQNAATDPDDVVGLTARPLYAICQLVSQLPSTVGTRIRRQLADRVAPDMAASVRLAEFSTPDLAFALIIYSRLHGVVALQAAEIWQRNGMDADTMFQLELDLLLAHDQEPAEAEAAAPSPAPPGR